MTTTTSFYTLGGPLRIDAPTYVTRQADEAFYQGLLAGHFCYVLNARQMGKSSLQVQTQKRLEAAGVACAVIDMSQFGKHATDDQFYAGIILTLAERFHLQNFNIDNWWKSYEMLSAVHHFGKFVEEVLLVQVTQPIVIFIDETDALRRFSEDFFVVIRSFYNARSQKPAYRRLTFGILGVASPADLIADDKITPFNIGKAIDLTGFQVAEAQPLEVGLAPKSARPQKVLEEVLKWTGGQPFLTQKLCYLLSQTEAVIPEGEEVNWVAQLVRAQVLENWAEKDEPSHLRAIRDRILPPQETNMTYTGRLLGLYQQVLTAGEAGREAVDDSDELRLRLTGLVVKRHGRLQVYNRVYAEVFNAAWVSAALDNLRPYAVVLRNWEASQKNASWLLRGQALTEALEWARNKSLADVDHEFLTASRLAEEKAGAQRRLQRFLWIALLVVLGLAGVAGWEWWLTLQQEKRLVVSLKETQAAKQRAEESQQGMLVQKDKVLRTQSRFLADLARQERANYNFTNATLLALEALSKSVSQPDRFLIFEAEVQLYNAVVQMRERALLKRHQADVLSATFSPNGLQVVTASWDNTARLWEVPSGRLLAILTGHKWGVNATTFSPSGQQVVTASLDGTARLWEIPSGQLLAVCTGHEGGVTSATFSPSGQQVVTASWDNTARLWEVPSGKLLVVLTGHESSVSSATFSPSGQQVVTASHDKTARLWEVPSGQLLAVLTGHEDKVSSATFSPSGQQVVTVSEDNTARLWKVPGGQLLAVFTGHKSSVSSATFSPSGQQVVTASHDKTARLWEVPSGQLLAVLTGHEDKVSSATFSSSGQQVVTASSDKTARLWEVPNGKLLAVLKGHEDIVHSTTFSPSGQQVVTVSWDGTVRLWEVPSGRLLMVLTGYESGVTSATFSPDGLQMVTASSDTAQLWEVPSGQLLAVLKGHESAVYSATFGPNGQQVVTASWDNTARLWEVPSGKLLAVLRGHKSYVFSATFSPSGRQVVTASSDKTARLWEVPSGKLLAVLTGHASGVNSATFSPNGQQVVTASEDNTARLWEVPSGKLLAIFETPERVKSAEFSPNGQSLLTATGTEAWIWPLFPSTQAMIDYARQVVPRQLSCEERERFFLVEKGECRE